MICVSVCLSASINKELHVHSSHKILCILPMAVAGTYSGGIAIRYVLPVLRMTSNLPYRGMPIPM